MLSPIDPAKLREAESLLEMASLITKRTETAAGSTMNPSQRTRTEMGTDMYQVENSREQSPDNSGYKCYQSMCTDVVIDVVIVKTTAYCRLQRTKEYTKANYSLRAKSQTSSALQNTRRVQR